MMNNETKTARLSITELQSIVRAFNHSTSCHEPSRLTAMKKIEDTLEVCIQEQNERNNQQAQNRMKYPNQTWNDIYCATDLRVAIGSK